MSTDVKEIMSTQIEVPSRVIYTRPKPPIAAHAIRLFGAGWVTDGWGFYRVDGPLPRGWRRNVGEKPKQRWLYDVSSKDVYRAIEPAADLFGDRPSDSLSLDWVETVKTGDHPRGLLVFVDHRNRRWGLDPMLWNFDADNHRAVLGGGRRGRGVIRIEDLGDGRALAFVANVALSGLRGAR